VTSLKHHSMQIRYGRHFFLLGLFAASLILWNRFAPANRLITSFAVYGALHAVAFVLTLRSNAPLGRRVLFVVAAALLSMVTLEVGLAGTKVMAGSLGRWGLEAVLGVSSAIGAVCYGCLIRRFWVRGLSLGSLAAISAGCMLATLLAFHTLDRFSYLGRGWLAVLWWWAFSLGLWWSRKRQSSTI
jgi:hypothetical protein